MSSSAQKTSRKPKCGTRKKRYGRRLHRAQLALKKVRSRVSSLEDELARLGSRPAGVWARLKRWLHGASVSQTELLGPCSSDTRHPGQA